MPKGYAGMSRRFRGAILLPALPALLFLGVGCRRSVAPLSAPAAEASAPSAAPAPDVRLAAAPPAPAPWTPEGLPLTLLYSSNLLGEYEAHPLGGLARRATVTARARAEGPPLVQVDAGDSVLPVLETPIPDRGEVERRAQLMVSGLARLGLDALVPGETDLALGPPVLERLARRAGLALLAANLTRAGKRWLPPDRLVRRGELAVGIFGVVDLPDLPAPLAQTDPAAAARAAVTSLRARGARLVVGLAHLSGGVAQARALAREVEGIDVLVVGHDGETLERPIEEGRTRIVEAHRRGTYLGRLDLDLRPTEVAARNQILRLEPTAESDPALRAHVRAYVEETLRRIDKKVPAALSPAPAPQPEEIWSYGSNGACKMCHESAVKQWHTTPHAAAMQTLESKGRQRDPYCFGCHVTAFRRPGGTKSLETATTYFAGVGCESCHGPSVAHVRADKATGTRRDVPAAVCLECHRADQQPEPFDYQQALKLVLGPGHGDGGKGKR